MILGVDLGNYATKTSNGINFPSKCSIAPDILKNIILTTNEGTVYIGEGNYDTEYRKIKKEFIKQFFIYAIALSTNDIHNKVVVGLPLSQYRNDCEALRNILLSNSVYDISINHISRKIIIDDIAVYPEGLGAVAGSDFEGVLIDIGGRTTDACEVIDNNGVKKVSNPISIPKGTLNLDSDFIKILNSKGLDLKTEDAGVILRKGLKIDGITVDISAAMEVFKQFVSDLYNRLQIEYSIRTREVALIGGGCQLLHKPLMNRLPAARLINNAFTANADGFGRKGLEIWQ